MPSLPPNTLLRLELWYFPPKRRGVWLNLSTIFQSQCFCRNREEALCSQGPVMLCPENRHYTLSLYSELPKMPFLHLRLDRCSWHNLTACKGSSIARSVSLDLPSGPLFTSNPLRSTITLHPSPLLQLTWCNTSYTQESPPSPHLAPFETLHYLVASFLGAEREKRGEGVHNYNVEMGSRLYLPNKAPARVNRKQGPIK